MQEFDLSLVDTSTPTFPKSVRIGAWIVFILAIVRLAVALMMINDQMAREPVIAVGDVMITEAVIAAILAVVTLQGILWAYALVLPLAALEVAGAAMVGEQFAALLGFVALLCMACGYKELRAYSVNKRSATHQHSPAAHT